MNYKTTKKDFQEFKKECEYWIKYFRISGWEIHFIHSSDPDGRACCFWDEPGRISTISLNLSWSMTPVKNEIKRTAFHEVCELLLARLQNQAMEIKAKLYVSETAHEIIRVLENSIFIEKRK